MKPSKWLWNYIAIFVFSVVALGVSLFLYIYWYVEVSSGLQAVIRRFNLDPAQFFDFQTWVVIVVLSILVGVILVGIFIIFVFSLKTLRLYQLQHNFINNFTHELKTPVTSLQLYLETFKKHELPRDNQLKYLNFMLDDVGRLTSNINRILNLAKIEGGLYEGHLVRVDLVNLVEEFCLKNQQLFKGCQVRIHNPSGLAFVYPVDLVLFEMLLMNLFTNAITCNDTGSPAVDITFAVHKNRLHLMFQDNGLGLEKTELKKIFKKFYQVKNTGRPQGIGSGLGLYLVENIVRFHKGKIVADSRGLGCGTTFIIMLPLIADQ